MKRTNPTLAELREILAPYVSQVMVRDADDSHVGGDWIAFVRIKRTAGSWKFRRVVRGQVGKLLRGVGVKCSNVGEDVVLVKRWVLK